MLPLMPPALRIPDTFNYKTDRLTLGFKHAADSMLSLTSIEQRLEPYHAVTPLQARGVP